jgi:BlaI family transcriptional regulator, penicillinase repressor
MAKKLLAALSPAETQILRIVWQLGEATIQRVCDNLPKERNIVYATVQTLLRRLERKGYVSHKAEGKAYIFYPVAKRDDVINRTVGDFVDRLFGGDAFGLMMHLAKHSKLSGKDIERLGKIIKEKP